MIIIIIIIIIINIKYNNNNNNNNINIEKKMLKINNKYNSDSSKLLIKWHIIIIIMINLSL